MVSRARMGLLAAAVTVTMTVSACQFSGTAHIVGPDGSCTDVSVPTVDVQVPTAPTQLPGPVLAPCPTSGPATSVVPTSTTTPPTTTTTVPPTTTTTSSTTSPTSTTILPTTTTPPTTTTTPPPVSSRPYFAAADWLWAPIPASPRLDPQSAAMASQLGTGQHVADTIAYGAELRGPTGITASTPRYDIAFSAGWGPDPFGSDKMPIPADVTTVPSGGDKALAVADPINGKVYSLFVAQKSGSGWKAAWGGAVALNGDGRETNGGSSTGSDISRFAGVVRASEIQAGQINHALFFSTNMAAKGTFRYPAAKSDGSNMTGVSTPIPEGSRVQLDPSIDLTKIPGITKAELAVGTALQRYGAYVGDNGGARMAFTFEYLGTSSAAQAPYTAAGMGSGDYYGFPHLPWNRLRVLAASTGQ